MNLTERQRRIIDQAAADIAPERLDDFHKYIADVLRPRREIWDSDVGRAVAAALVKCAPRSWPTWRRTRTGRR
jgi:hypothetical protein